MKKVLFGLVAGSVALSTSALAEPGMSPYQENTLVKVCEAVKTDNKMRLHSMLKQNHMTVKQVAEGLKCNGQDVVSFAHANNAEDTAHYIEMRDHLAD